MFYNSVGFTVYICIIAAVLGLVMGSFLNCAAVRMINGESIIKGRSHCGDCGHVLGPLDLVPVFSWLFLKGKCRYCGAKLSARYLFTELISAAAFVTITLKYGLTVELVEMLILGVLLLCISFTDLEGYIIPDRLILAGIAVRLVFVLISGNTLSELGKSLIGGFSISLPLLIIVLLMEKLTGRESMGGGDIKLVFMAGLYFTWTLNLLAFMAACAIGIVTGLLSIKVKSSEDRHIPFGPSIAAGFWFAALFGQPLIDWYMKLF